MRQDATVFLLAVHSGGFVHTCTPISLRRLEWTSGDVQMETSALPSCRILEIVAIDILLF